MRPKKSPFQVFEPVTIQNGGYYADKPARILEMEQSDLGWRYKVAVKISDRCCEMLWIYDYDLKKAD